MIDAINGKLQVSVVPIGTVALKAKTWNPLRDAPDESFKYVDLSSVDQLTKSIVEAREVVGRDAPSRARQIVAKDDVLVATVRPNLNGVAKVTESLDQATASTGFCVIRPDTESLDANYLFQWVKSPAFIADMVRKSTGANYPAVSDRIIFESIIPLPPLSEQKRIAEILDRAESLRRQRRAALALLDELTQSIFLDMFGDPVSNPMGWPVEVVGNLDLKIADGNYSSKYPTNAEFIELGVPFIRANNMRDMTIIHEDMRFISPEKHSELKKGHLKAGDVLVTTRGEIGNVAIVPPPFQDANINAQIVLLRATSNQLNQRFLGHQLAMPQVKLRMQSFQNGVALKQLPIRQLVRVPLFVPPSELQETFAELIQEVDETRGRLRRSETELDQLFASLQHRAFRGEL